MCRNVGSDPTSLSTRPATPLSCIRVRGPNHLHHGEDHRRGCKSESSFKLPGSRRLHATAGLQIFFFEVWRGEAEGWKERSSVCLTDTHCVRAQHPSSPYYMEDAKGQATQLGSRCISGDSPI